MGGLEFLILPLLLVGLLWMMGAPQRRMRKEQAAMLQQLAPGAEVMTHGGLYGTVVEIVDDVVVLETAPGVTMRWATRAIARVVEPLPEPDEDQDGLADDEYADDEYDEYEDDEYADDADDADDEELADEAAPLEGEDAAQEWEDVEVPDDASSLTDEDDDKPGR